MQDKTVFENRTTDLHVTIRGLDIGKWPGIWICKFFQLSGQWRGTSDISLSSHVSWDSHSVRASLLIWTEIGGRIDLRNVPRLSMWIQGRGLQALPGP